MTGLTQLDLPRDALDASLTLYERVASQLWEDLRGSGARPGDRLPSERVLTERYHVSRVTMRSALNALAVRGAVESAASRGWFVTGEVTATSPTAHVQGFADYAKLHHLTTKSKILMSRVRACTVREAQQLHIAPGTELFEMRRVRSLDDMVVVLEHNRLPLPLCSALATTDFTKSSLYETLLTANPPQIPRSAEYAVEARPPNKEELRVLDLHGSSVPVLLARQLTLNQHQEPLELTDQAYRGDRYQFRATIA